MSLNKIFKGSLSKKILFLILFTSSIVTTVVTSIQLYFDYTKQVEGISEYFPLIKRSYLKSITRSVWDYNDSQVKIQLEGIANLPNIVKLEVFPSEGKPIFFGDSLNVKSLLSHKFDLVKSIGDVRYNIGSLKVYATLDEVKKNILQKLFMTFFLQFLKTISVSIVILILLKKILLDRLADLGKIVSTYNPQNFQQGTEVNSFLVQRNPDEIDFLYHKFSALMLRNKKFFKQLEDLNKNLEHKVYKKTSVILDQRSKVENTNRLAALGEVAAGIAHEINNPLMGINLSASMAKRYILKNEETDKTMKYLDNIEKTVIQIRKITDSMRDLSRDSSQEDLSSVSISKILDSVLGLCEQNMLKNHIDFKTEIDPPLRRYILQCRQVQISQTLLNLISNAIDAVRDEDEKIIRIGAYLEGGNINLYIEDSGKGVSAEVEQKIFNPFFTTKPVGSGTGIGLSFSMSVVSAHKGKLLYKRVGDRSRFILSLPQTKK